MQIKIRFLELSIALALATAADAQTVVPLTSEPSHHLAISNEYVRAFKVEVAPHAETLYHLHDHDYVYVTLGDTEINNVVLHGQNVRMALKDGQVRFSKAPLTHKAQNNGDQPFRNVTVEFLRGIGTPECGLPGAQQSCGIGPGWSGGVDGNSEMSSGYAQPVFRASHMTVDEFTTKGGSEIPEEAIPQAPFLIIAVSSLKFRLNSQKGTQELTTQPFDIFWNDEPLSRFEVLSPAARFVVISFAAQKTQ